MSLINNGAEQTYKQVQRYSDQREPLCGAILKDHVSNLDVELSVHVELFMFLSINALSRSEKHFMVVVLSIRKCNLLLCFVGKMPPVLACRAFSQISVFCGRSNGRVQYATVYFKGIQGYRCKGKLQHH